MSIFSKFSKMAKRKNKYSSFADFFINASEKEKLRVFRKAAEESNKDQRKIMGLK